MNANEKEKAIFLDRDGVVNEMVYYPEHGIVDSPFTPGQFEFRPGVGEAIRLFRELGFKVVLVSNQPGIAKGHFTREAFEEIREKMTRGLAAMEAPLDGEYYCLHHPEAKFSEFRQVCRCRKPEPGLLLRAADEMGLELARSWMVGDGLTDIQAGRRAGTRTILLGKMKCELCNFMEAEDSLPDAICSNLEEVTMTIERMLKYPDKAEVGL